MLVLSDNRRKVPPRKIRSKDHDLQMEKYELLFRNNTIGTSSFFKPMNPPPFSLTNNSIVANQSSSNSIMITPGNQNQADNLTLPNYHDVNTNEGDATHDAAILLTSIKNLACKEISCKPPSVSINLPSIPDLERHFERPTAQQQGIDVHFDQVTGSISKYNPPRTLNACLTSVLSVPMSDTSRIRTVSMDSHQSENEGKYPIHSPIHHPKTLTQPGNTSCSPQIPNVQKVEEPMCVTPSASSSLHVIPTDAALKSPKRNIDRRKRYLDAHKEDPEEENGPLVDCQNVANDDKDVSHNQPPTKRQKVPTSPSSRSNSTKAQDHAQDSSVKKSAKAILKKKFSWKNYPELENFLIANREEYLRHSALNYTMEQKQYNNRLTERLIELASECGYVFDQDSFTFVSIRDRIRCYFKSYVQSRKKRGVIIGYAARKAGLLDEKQLEKNAGSKAKIITVSKQRVKKL